MLNKIFFFNKSYHDTYDLIIRIQVKTNDFEIWRDLFALKLNLVKGPFKYYVIKEVGGWGQKMAIFDDLQYCKSSKKWVGGPKNVKNMT